MGKRKWTKEQFIRAIENNFSIRAALTEVGLKPTGANYTQFQKYVKEFGLDMSHFTGQAYLKGKRCDWSKEPILLENVLVENSDYSRWSLRTRLIKEGLLEYKCKICGLKDWQGADISLHLDHINGINNDNRIENLRLICPNCHSQTSTYGGRNRKEGNHTNAKCQDCGKKVWRDGARCMPCAAKARRKENGGTYKTKIDWPKMADLQRMVDESNLTAVAAKIGVSRTAVREHLAKQKIKWPPVEKLIEMVEKDGYSATGRKLGVSDNAVRKRILAH